MAKSSAVKYVSLRNEEFSLPEHLTKSSGRVELLIQSIVDSQNELQYSTFANSLQVELEQLRNELKVLAGQGKKSEALLITEYDIKLGKEKKIAEEVLHENR